MKLPVLLLLAAAQVPASATTYYVNGSSPKASDTNAGTRTAPWKTIARAGAARELKPGDTVRIEAGVYREQVAITVSGEPGRPITFAAAPGARVVIKGSEIVRGPWHRLSERKDLAEPFAHAFQRVWFAKLGDEFFTDKRFQGAYDNKSKRWVSQVFWDDDHPLQMIGPDAIYKNDEYVKMVNIGSGLADMIPQSFWFDARDQTLYVNIAGDPGWYSIEVGVRGFALTASKVHDVVVRGIEMRHNRQPGGQWPLASIGESERVVLEDCQFRWADFCGLGVGNSKYCVVRRCDASHNGCIGMAMGNTEDCIAEDCTMLFNNYRQINGDWGVAAGMKNIPGNKRTTIRRCEAAYNNEAEGIWFDTDNSDIRILDNVCHDNGDCGIFFEIHKAGGTIAGNLVYGNHGRGIYVSGSQNTWVVHNTVVENASGIVAMTRGKGEPASNTHILNNLMIRNYITSDTVTRGSDLTLEMSAEPVWRHENGSASDHNVFANNTWVPFMRHNWNDNNTFERWRDQFHQDAHSVQTTVPYARTAVGFRLLDTKPLEIAQPLPAAVTRVWKPANPKRVGANLTRWPAP